MIDKSRIQCVSEMEYLLFPYSREKAELLKKIYQQEDVLKSDRIGYEKHLTSSSPLFSVYQHYPLHDAEKQVTRISNLPAEEIWEKADALYRQYSIDHPAGNIHLEKLYRFLLTYDLISRLRFNRGVDILPGQNDIPEIIDHVMEKRWFEEYLSKVTADPAYEYKEYYPVQVIIALHTAAHFFQLPFPTLFCLRVLQNF